MRIAHIFQHVPFEDIGSMAEWLDARGFFYRHTRFYEARYALPALSEINMLIVIGGPMGVHDERPYPWLAEEKRFIRQAIDTEKIVIGVCLGAQLIADVLGAAVAPHDQKEIGWFPIEWTDEAIQHPIGTVLERRQTVFHWHGDSFAIPAGAVHLAKSEACVNQGFLWSGRVLGLQFHLEITESGVLQLIAHGGYELAVRSKYVMDGEAIQARREYFESMKGTLHRILDHLLAEAGSITPCG